MFRSLKLYTGATIDLEYILAELSAELGYKRQERTQEEGDFSRRGDVIDIFPFAFELPIRIALDQDTISSIKTFNPDNGNPLWEHKMVIVLPVKKPHTIKTLPFKEEFPIDNFVDLDIGDYVVHNEHGIGRFLGLDKIKIGSTLKDHLVLEYDGAEKLYVPVDQMNLVQKYISFQARKPKLYRLGSQEWQATKRRVRKGIQKTAWELISLQAMRMSVAGFAYSKDVPWQKDFEKTFPFLETPDQAKAAVDVKADM